MRTILITGCSTGIGKALATAFKKNGDQVIATARNTDSIADLVSLGCRTAALDVNDPGSIAQLMADLDAPIDMLVNNAGIAQMGPVADLPLDVLRHQLETNTISPVAMVQATLPLLQQAKNPIIVNIGSVSGILTTPFAGAYCASKAALHALNDALRMELKPLGIQVVNVQPGKIQSALGDNATAGVDAWLNEGSRYWHLKAAIYARARAQQEGATTAEEFAEAVVKALASDRPDPVIRLGNASQMIPFMQRWIPKRGIDTILSKKFGLNQNKTT